MMIIDMNCLVRAIDFNGSSLLIGTRDGSISVTANGEVTGTIMNSHSDGEVWGLAHGHDGTIVTSGDDNKVMIWDVQNRKLDKVAKVTDRVKKIRRGASTLSKYPDSQCSRCVATNGSLMAVSGNDGQVSVRNISEPNEIVHEITEPKEWNEVMAFSPDGAYLAVGSHDNNIYVYSTSDFALVGTCRGHNSYIMALDWCAHSKYIRSNCGAYELLFFTVPDCQ